MKKKNFLTQRTDIISMTVHNTNTPEKA